MCAVAACTGQRLAAPAPPAPATEVQGGQADNSPPASAPPQTASSPTAAENSGSGPPPSPVPNCVPPPPAPKTVKAKPKPVHKESPPQLSTAPEVAQTPPGGVVEAQVRSMPVAVMSILGKRVKGPRNEDLGRVVDVLADATGRVRIAIIDFGGFLGVGDRRIAVDWPLLRFTPDATDPSLLLSVGLDQLKAAPEYKGTPRPQALMVPETRAASAETKK